MYRKNPKTKSDITTKREESAKERIQQEWGQTIEEALGSLCPNYLNSTTLSVAVKLAKKYTSEQVVAAVKTEMASLSKVPLACQRCREMHRSCDGQRPCQRCKDAGIGVEDCTNGEEDDGPGDRCAPKHLRAALATLSASAGPPASTNVKKRRSEQDSSEITIQRKKAKGDEV